MVKKYTTTHCYNCGIYHIITQDEYIQGSFTCKNCNTHQSIEHDFIHTFELDLTKPQRDIEIDWIDPKYTKE